MNKVDVYFDFRKESKGRDPDRWSPTLQEYHRILWSKPLPNGKIFTLDKIDQNRLYHKSDLGEFYLSSDVILYGYIRKCHKLDFVTSEISKNEIENFRRLTINTLGGTVIWPSKRIDNKITINGARGFNGFISDRLDLTIECIRRSYLDEISPLYKVFKRYSDFFTLFGNFKGYIDFFHFQDCIDEKGQVKFALPFKDFEYSPLPKTIEEYMQYKIYTSDIIIKRNERILGSVS